MNRVLVTGATGFIGRHCLALLLARGYEVHALSSQAIEQYRTGVHWHQVDLFDSLRVRDVMAEIQPTHMLHFAWVVTHGTYWNSTDNIRWVQASLDLLRAFTQLGGQRVVMAGTCAEYDWKYGYCSERITPLSPVTLYGVCKHSLQIIQESFAKQVGLSQAWGRIFFLYGPHESPERLVSSVIRSLLRGDVAHCSHGNQIRDFLYVEDAADAFVALLRSEVTGSVNIASGQPVALKHLVYKLAAKMNRPDLIQLGARPTAANDPPLLVANVARLTHEIGWSPKYDLDHGLDLAIQWWDSYLKRSR